MCTCLLIIESINIYNAWMELSEPVYFLTPIIKIATFVIIKKNSKIFKKNIF